jgi:hypothetical protein
VRELEQKRADSFGIHASEYRAWEALA